MSTTRAKRAIILVIDGLGIGVEKGEPPNTLRSLIAHDTSKRKRSGVYEDLRSFVGRGTPRTLSSVVTPAYEGADSYKGHYEMIGVDVGTRNVFIEEHLHDLKAHSRLNEISHGICELEEKYYVSNNIEAELGTSVNLIGDLDRSSKDELVNEGKKLSKLLKCQRVIVMANHDVSSERILRGVRERSDSGTGKTVRGIIPSLCDLYDDDYFSYHVGRSLDTYKTANLIESAFERGCGVALVGKVGDILQVEHDLAESIPCVTSANTYDHLQRALKTDARLIFGNFQQVDLMCHACRPEDGLKSLLEVCGYIDTIKSRLRPDDLMLVTADHGNDPGGGNNAHTRERVPLLVYNAGGIGEISKSYGSLSCVFDIAKRHLGIS